MKNFPVSFAFVILFTLVFLLDGCALEPVANSFETPFPAVDVPPLITPMSDNKTWVSAEFRGIRIGRDTDARLKKLLGEPNSVGTPEDKIYENDSEEEIWERYTKTSFTEGSVESILGKKTRIIKAVSVYPVAQISLEEIINKFGPNFFQINSWEPICIGPDKKMGELNKKMAYPYCIVYPEKGVLIDIREYEGVEQVGRIDYLSKCEDL